MGKPAGRIGLTGAGAPRPGRPRAGLALVGAVIAGAAVLCGCGATRPSAGGTTTSTRPVTPTRSSAARTSITRPTTSSGARATTSATAPRATTSSTAARATTSTAAGATTSSTTAPATTSTGRRTATTTAAEWRPPQPSSSPYTATDQLIAAWSAHHRAAALAVASPGAVKALFALQYPSAGLLQDGCSAPPGNAPSVCTYRYGATQDLLSVSVTAFAAGWGVTGVTLES